MSGIEVAGLVLAVLPIFISACENYRKGLEPAKAFFKWERQLPGYIRSLRSAAAMYEMQIDILIAPITSDTERDAMTDRSYNALWKDVSMQSRIRDRLGKASSAFESNMEQFEAVCRDVAACLDLEEALQSSAVRHDKLDMLLNSIAENSKANKKPKEFSFQLRRRAKFACSETRIKSLLQELQRCNNIMRDLTGLVVQIQPYRSKTRKPAVQHLHRIHDQACKLYEAISRAWPCVKHPGHLAGIQLEGRLSASSVLSQYQPIIKTGDWCLDCVFFRLVFAASGTPHDFAERAAFRELEIAVSGFEETETRAMPTVKIHEPSAKEQATIDVAKLEIVNNLCSAVHQEGSPIHCFGFHLDGLKKCLRGSYAALPHKIRCGDGDVELVLLSELISCRKRHSDHKDLTPRQREILPVTVTSSLLQLHSTAWSKMGWSKQSISFVRIANEGVDVERPLMIHSLRETSSDQDLGPTNTRKAVLQSQIALLSLGVLLLELYTCETIEERCRQEEKELPKMGEDLKTLDVCKEWLADKAEYMSAGKQSAISFCLESFVGFKTDLAEATFRKEVHDKVLTPLQEEARQFLGPGTQLV